ATGKRDYYNKTFHGTKKQADTWLSRALTRHANGEPLEESAKSFGTWLDEWLKIKSRSVKPRTKEIYADIVERILKPDLGKRALVKIAPADIQKLLANRSEITTCVMSQRPRSRSPSYQRTFAFMMPDTRWPRY